MRATFVLLCLALLGTALCTDPTVYHYTTPTGSFRNQRYENSLNDVYMIQVPGVTSIHIDITGVTENGYDRVWEQKKENRHFGKLSDEDKATLKHARALLRMAHSINAAARHKRVRIGQLLGKAKADREEEIDALVREGMEEEEREREEEDYYVDLVFNNDVIDLTPDVTVDLTPDVTVDFTNDLAVDNGETEIEALFIS
ncbi:hypothetical protein KIPB_004739 [Kipferlia bialata]|uniref:Uncharacterized protein n=1 Tax=Kipferlia bialata TaxID=797122 RepID=A0A9K3CVJ8_9EUKA|nr:hypothetical protein KIPB_004739 [Kipferlia bialata]|eukprot:g4739.t1